MRFHCICTLTCINVLCTCRLITYVCNTINIVCKCIHIGVHYRATQLGMATVASALSPSDSLWVFSELSKARKNFALENELHLLYQVCACVCVFNDMCVVLTDNCGNFSYKGGCDVYTILHKQMSLYNLRGFLYNL